MSNVIPFKRTARDKELLEYMAEVSKDLVEAYKMLADKVYAEECAVLEPAARCVMQVADMLYERVKNNVPDPDRAA